MSKETKGSLTKTMVNDVARRIKNNEVVLAFCSNGEEPLYSAAQANYAPIDSGWLKYKGNLVKKMGDTYHYV